MNRFNTSDRLLLLASAFLAGSLTLSAQDSVQSLQKALTLHASFDKGFDADFAKGDKRLFTCFRPGNQSEAKPGLNADGKTQRVPSLSLIHI